MTEQSPEDILRKLEDDTTNHHFDRAGGLWKVVQAYEKRGDEEKSEKARIEARTFELRTKQRNKVFPGYFQPWWASSEEEIAEAQEFFNKEALSYLADKAGTVSNPIHAARFADVVWDLAVPKNPAMAKLAIQKYLDCTDLYHVNGWGTDFGDAIKRAATLAATIHDAELLSAVKERVLNYMRELDDKREYRFCQDLASVLRDTSRLNLGDTEWQEVVDVLDRAATYYQEKHSDRAGSFGPVSGPREILVRDFHEKKLALAKRTNLTDAKTERTAVAESYEREGDLKLDEDNPLAAVAVYLPAEQAYKELGQRENMDRVRVKLREAGVRSREHMQTVESAVPIKAAEIEKYIEPLLGDDLPDTLQRVSASSLFIPDLDETRSSAEQTYETSISQRIFPRITFGGEYTVAYHGGDEELWDVAVRDDLIVHIQLAAQFRAFFFDKLKKDYGLGADSLLNHFRAWGACRSRNLEFLKRGFGHYFAGDHVSALHILVPQFEDTLRSLLAAANRPIARPLKGTATLGALLDDPAFKQADDENLHRYYEFVLLEEGFNLRNSVAHGLLEPEDMNRLAVELVIDLLLTLTSFSAEEITEKDAGK